MNDANLTEWYPADIPPVRKGVYQTMETEGICYAYWDGHCFGFRVLAAIYRPKEAYRGRKLMTFFPERQVWRGQRTKKGGGK